MNPLQKRERELVETSHLVSCGCERCIVKRAELNGIRLGIKREQEILKMIDKFKRDVFSTIDKPKEGTPIVTWSYSIAFIGNVLGKLKKQIKEGESK